MVQTGIYTGPPSSGLRPTTGCPVAAARPQRGAGGMTSPSLAYAVGPSCVTRGVNPSTFPVVHIAYKAIACSPLRARFCTSEGRHRDTGGASDPYRTVLRASTLWSAAGLVSGSPHFPSGLLNSTRRLLGEICCPHPLIWWTSPPVSSALAGGKAYALLTEDDAVSPFGCPSLLTCLNVPRQRGLVNSFGRRSSRNLRRLGATSLWPRTWGRARRWLDATVRRHCRACRPGVRMGQTRSLGSRP